MRLVKSGQHEERLVVVDSLLFFEPSNSLINDELTAEPLKGAYGRAVSYEVLWVLVRRGGVVLGCEPVIETEVARLGLAWIVE
jgi:hypothetical protein